MEGRNGFISFLFLSSGLTLGKFVFFFFCCFSFLFFQANKKFYQQNQTYNKNSLSNQFVEISGQLVAHKVQIQGQKVRDRTPWSGKPVLNIKSLILGTPNYPPFYFIFFTAHNKPKTPLGQCQGLCIWYQGVSLKMLQFVFKIPGGCVPWKPETKCEHWHIKNSLPLSIGKIKTLVHFPLFVQLVAIRVCLGTTWSYLGTEEALRMSGTTWIQFSVMIGWLQVKNWKPYIPPESDNLQFVEKPNLSREYSLYSLGFFALPICIKGVTWLEKTRTFFQEIGTALWMMSEVACLSPACFFNVVRLWLQSGWTVSTPQVCA